MTDTYTSLNNYIENTNLGILFSATHNRFEATYKKQRHIWSITFSNNTCGVIEEAVSPDNKFHEPSFIDLIYELSVNAIVYDNCQNNKPALTGLSESNSLDPDDSLIKMRGKRFKDLGIDTNIIKTIASFDYKQRWTLWKPGS